MFKRIFVNAPRTLKNAPAEGAPLHIGLDWAIVLMSCCCPPAPSMLFLDLKYPSNSMPIKRETEHNRRIGGGLLNAVSHNITKSY